MHSADTWPISVPAAARFPDWKYLEEREVPQYFYLESHGQCEGPVNVSLCDGHRLVVENGTPLLSVLTYHSMYILV